MEKLNARVGSEIIEDDRDLKEYSFSSKPNAEPFLLEKLSKLSSGMSWNLYVLKNISFNFPLLNALKRRVNETVINSDDKKIEWQHVIGPAMAGYVLATLPGEKIDTKKVIELSCKTTLAITLVDNYIDEIEASDEEKLQVIDNLRLAFETGYIDKNDNVSEQINLAYVFASEVFLDLNEFAKFDLFNKQIAGLAEVAKEQHISNQRSIAGSIKAGARSLGIIASIPMVLNENIPKRFLRAAKNFGGMIEIADDLQDRESDLRRGLNTFATELEPEQTYHDSLPPKVSAAFIRQARRCFEYLTVSERDAYLFLWRTLKHKWEAFKIDSDQIAPPTNYILAGASIDSKSTFRAVSEHGRYWGPFFIQPRIGKGGRVFQFYKFRSMRPFGDDGSDVVIDPLSGKQKNIKRITLLGSISRKLHLDEIPNIINLFKGDFSQIVGIRPRPDYQFKKHDKEIQEYYLKYGGGIIDLNFALDGTPTEDDPDCSKQRTELIKDFYSKYEKRPWITTFSYLMKIAHNILIKGRRGV